MYKQTHTGTYRTLTCRKARQTVINKK